MLSRSEFNHTTLEPDDPSYPEALTRAPASGAPPTLHLWGDPSLLRRPLLALFCARQCPGRLIVKAQDWARTVRDRDLTVISGFHTPVESECLRVLLKGKVGLILCPARGLPKRLRPEWREPFQAGRLLLLSFFSDAQVRPTVEFALQRNRLVSALAGQVLIVHAPQASRTWDLAVSGMEEINGEYTLPDPANDALMEKGVEVFPEFGKYE